MHDLEQAMGSVGLLDYSARLARYLQFSIQFLLVGVCIPMILCTGIMVRIWQHLECPGVIMSVYTCHVVPPTRYPTDLYICLHIHNSMSLSLVYKYRFSM